MSKIACILAALVIAQASPPRARQVASERRPSEFGRTALSIFHVHSKDGFTCATHVAGGVCGDVSHWAVAIRWNEYTLETIGAALVEDAALHLEDADPKIGRRLSKRDLVIRADPTAPYGFTQPVIEASCAAGFYKIALAIGGPDLEMVDDLRIALFWNPTSKSAIRKVGTRTINDDADLRNLITEARERSILFLSKRRSDGTRDLVDGGRGRMPTERVGDQHLAVIWVKDLVVPCEWRVDDEPDREGILFGRVEVETLRSLVKRDGD